MVGPAVLVAQILVAFSLLFAAAVLGDAGPRFRILFIGNSLTSTNDLPEMVQSVAAASGLEAADFEVASVTRDGFSLRDHWDLGEARRAIGRGGWTHVVLQQGPSSLPASQEELIQYTKRFADDLRAVGAKVVLYGVWPPRDRGGAQHAVTDGYRRAAETVDGAFVPAGEGWSVAWTTDPTLPLAGADGFHPSLAGTYLAAVMIFEKVSGRAAARLGSRGPRLPDAQLDLIHSAARVAAAPARQAGRLMAITIDDLPTASVLGDDLPRAEKTTRDLVAAIRKAGVPAIGFVNERKLETGGTVDPRRVALLERWLDAGLDLGNHSYSHPDLHRIDVAAFEADVLRGEQVTRRLVQDAGRPFRFFRHPFLHTGRSREIRQRLQAFLTSRGYVVAPVTIDNYDYIFAAAYDRALAAGKAELAAKIRGEYVSYMDAVVGFYDQQAPAIVGRHITHTLLLHAHALNAATLESLVARLRARGYRFVTLAQALTDPAYATADEYYGPAGISWLHRWGLTKGYGGATFAGEPVVPTWVHEAAEIR
jgi:peptidoglycan/xylan/chitin deacetylase (PgdA/CDA1 family)